MQSFRLLAALAALVALVALGAAQSRRPLDGHAPPALTAFRRDGSAFDASDVLRTFGNLSRAEAASLQVGGFALQEKRSLLGDLDLLPTSDGGDVACQGSMNAKPMVFFGDGEALGLARRWLLTVPLDADGRVWDSSAQQYHQKSQGAWESASEWVLMAQHYAAHAGDAQAVFSSAPSRFLCYEDAGGKLRNGGPAGGDKLCTATPAELLNGKASAELGDVYATEGYSDTYTIKDSPRTVVSAGKRLVQRVSLKAAASALQLPLKFNHLKNRSSAYPATLCAKDVTTGKIVFFANVSWADVQITERGWSRFALPKALPPAMYDVALSAQHCSYGAADGKCAERSACKHAAGGCTPTIDSASASAKWLTQAVPTSSAGAGVDGGSRIETWGYQHAGINGTSGDANSCCAQSGSAASASSLASKLREGMLWQLRLARKTSGGFGVLVVADEWFNGVPASCGAPQCATTSSSSMWDQVRMGWKAAYPNMLFMSSISAWVEFEQAKLVPPLTVDGLTMPKILAQVKADVVVHLGYAVGGGRGFYSWIACNSSDASGMSTCDRDKPPSSSARWPKTEGGQSLIDTQDLFPQALAATLNVGGDAVRKRLQDMIAQGRYEGMVRNNLVPQESVDPRIVSSSDKWNPVDAKGFCQPTANGSMVYSGHCVCSNGTSAVGSACWGNFGNNQQNGGRVFSTMATVFESGPYSQSFADFKHNVLNLRSMTKQLNAKKYGTPLLSADRGYLRKKVANKVILAMCRNERHLIGPQPKDKFGDELCSYYKEITYGLRTGPRGMLLGFAVGTLGIHVSAAGVLSVYGADLTAASPSKTIALPAWVKGQWPAELKGARVGGMTVKGVPGVSLSCNASAALDTMDCAAHFPVRHGTRLKTDDAKPSRPHILLILADDLGSADVGFGGNPAAAAADPQLKTWTPTLDALASKGAIIRQHYSMHVCTPTRAALMTGRHPARFGAQHRTFGAGRPMAVPLTETLLPQRLERLGYATRALVGKWHLGFYSPECIPTARGFTYSYGYYGGDEGYFNHTMGPCHHEARGCVVPNIGFRDPCGRDWSRSGHPLQFDDTGEDSAFVLSRVAGEIVGNHTRDYGASAQSPLFLYLATQTTHAPYEAPADVLAKYDYINYHNRRPYAALVELLDQTVKNVTDAFRAHGLFDNTITVFLSDNGGPCHASGSCPQKAQSTCAGCNLPFRGYKHTLFEGGIRTAAFITGPGVIARVIDDSGSFFHVVDWTATLLSAVGAGAQESDPPLDSISAWAALMTSVRPLPRSEMIVQYDRALPPPPPSGPTADTIQACHQAAAVRRGNHKLILMADNSTLIYDVVNDPTESTALKNATMEQQLLTLLEMFGRSSVPAHLPPNDAISQGGKYNISLCGPEGDWPRSSGVWVPWRASAMLKADDEEAAGGKLLYSANFSTALDVCTETSLLRPDGRRARLPKCDWVLESQLNASRASAEKGRLLIKNNGGHSVLWANRMFEDNYELRYGFAPLNASNGLAIVFWSTTPVSDPLGSIFGLSLPARTGDYFNYFNGSVSTYSLSYFRPDGKAGHGICDRNKAGHCEANTRKDPGFVVQEAGNDLIAGRTPLNGKAFEVVVRKAGPSISVAVDGVDELTFSDNGSVPCKPCHGCSCPEPGPLAGGYIGLRQMQNTGLAHYTHFDVYSLKVDDEAVKCDAKWTPPGSKMASHAPNVMLIGDSISKGNSGYSLYVRDILQHVLPSGLAGDATSLVGTLQHGGGFGSDGQAAASQDGVAKVSCYDGNGTGSLKPKAWSVLTYNAGLHDCGRGSTEWVNSTAYEQNVRGIFGAMKSAATAAIFVATTPFDLKLFSAVFRQCVVERNGIAKRVAAEMGVGYNDLYSFVNEACLGVNYTECAFQTTGLHFFTRAPLPSGQQLTAISVANAVIRSLNHSELAPAPPLTTTARPQAYPWIFPCGLAATTPPKTRIEDGHGRWHNVTIPQVLVIGDSISSDAEGYGAELRRIFEDPLPWCGANQSIPSSEPADATGYCSARTGRGGPIRPFDARYRTATGALARVSHSGGWSNQKGNQWQAGNSSHGKACVDKWLGGQTFDVISINFGLHDCGCRKSNNHSVRPAPVESCSGNLRFGRDVSAAAYATNLLKVYEAASAALNPGGKIVYVPTTPGGEACNSTVSNPCIRDVNAIAQRVLGGKPDVVMADLHAAVTKACGGASYAKCKLQNTHDGHHFTKAGQTFTAVVVAHAIAPLLGPRWMAILKKL